MSFPPVTGLVAALDRDDVDSDQILPGTYMRGINPDYAAGFFGLWRKDPDFVLNRPALRGTPILLAGRNFGCGSTREHAAWAVKAFGIRVLLAESFAEVFRDNCLKNGVLAQPLPHPDLDVIRTAQGPVTIDLQHRRITGPGLDLTFAIAAEERTALLEGLDDIGMSLKLDDAITGFECRERGERPWLQRMVPIA